ncbi:hypothetical protein LTR08_005177 [Meristemomyces frigidus]|nr:hypothetical protein LTR08_005177 [Meristemomyces frigidus]
MSDLDECAEGGNGLKRRRSEDGEGGERKRIAVELEDAPAGHAPEDTNTEHEDTRAAAADAETAEPRRKSGGIAAEKQRSKRLFGALLGNLNKPGGDRTSLRRQEIEARRKAELLRQDEERREEKALRLERRTERRREVQVAVDEDQMRMRHEDLLDTANFLQTVAEPKLYYRPWDLRPDEEDRIDEQIKEAQARVDSELTGRETSEDGYTEVEETEVEKTAAAAPQPTHDDATVPSDTGAPEPSAREPHAGEASDASPRGSTGNVEAQQDTPAKSAATDHPTNARDAPLADVPDAPATNRDTRDDADASDGERVVSAAPDVEDAKLPDERQSEVDDEGEGDGVDGEEDAVIY